jgi:hypothetical protein
MVSNMAGTKERREPSNSYLHGVKVSLSVAQAAATSGTDKIILWDVENWDAADLSETKYHHNITNNSRLTAPRDGKYTLKSSLDFATNATGVRSVGYKINGGATLILNTIAAASSDTVAGFVDIALSEGDYLEIVANHTAGASLDVESSLRTFASLQFNGF